ncbi:MAG: hypothetical protein ACP6IP_07895 [Candidatus Njordarchaeia archaeon]
MEEEEKKGVLLAKIFGILFMLVGIGLIFIGVLQIVEIPQLNISELQQLKSYLSSVGTINLFLYGILSLVLGAGIFRMEEWAAGGSFVLLLIVIVNLSATIWYWVSNFGTANLPMTIVASIIVVMISILILIYLIWAKGWR